MFKLFKRYLPQGLYGRAALIMLLPIVLLQLTVSIVFVQRHFEGVTEQLARGVKNEIGLLSDLIFDEKTPTNDIQKLANALEIVVESYDSSGEKFQKQRRFYDLTGIIVQRELLQQNSVIAVDLPDDYVVRILIGRGNVSHILSFSRERVSASNPHQLIVNMLIFGALFTLIAFIYLRNQLRPITRLAAASEAFGLGRSVDYKPAGAIEVRAAGKAFLDMRARIERHIEQRTLLLSGVSHDLRTPLTRLRLGIAMLEHSDKEALEKDATEMQALIDEFLSFTRGQAEASVKAERADIWSIITNVVLDAQKDGKNLYFDDPGEPLFLDIRPLAIRRAMENLISNGLRYATSVRISTVMEGHSLHIIVEDDGPGIPGDKVHEALKPFSRLDTARNQNRGSGVGLGLPIVADIAHAHGGNLILSKSDAMGGLKANFVIGLIS